MALSLGAGGSALHVAFTACSGIDGEYKHPLVVAPLEVVELAHAGYAALRPGKDGMSAGSINGTAFL